MVDFEGRIKFANNFICELVGTSSEKAVGASCFEFMFPEDLERAKTVLETTKPTNPRAFKFNLRHTNGSSVRVRVQRTPLTRPNGYLFGVLVTVVPLKIDSGPEVGVALASKGWQIPKHK